MSLGRCPFVLYGTRQHEEMAIRKGHDQKNADDEDGLDLSDVSVLQSWRVRDRMKTISVALVLCLNIGVDPPGVVKPNPCARMECWIDPLSMPPQKALDSIGKYLQQQYERWQPRARYKVSPDPTVDDVKKLCTALRRNAKDERVLLHYNGHGVPLPTTNGEVWVFNKTYTQYIPLSIYDLQVWMGAPSIYVFDCSAAGLIVSSFQKFAAHHEQEQEQLETKQRMGSGGAGDETPVSPAVSYKNCILLASCQANEILPTNPDLPADLFTSCLTTPIKMSLRWFAPRSLLGITTDKLDRIPGRLNDRKTLLGELNWFFTAITDTIAWNVLPRKLFKRLFRQDLLVASLFRNFLLAERIMWTVNCTPVSEPKLPSTHNHPLWQAWDYTVEQCLAQLPAMLAVEDASHARASHAANEVANGPRAGPGRGAEGLAPSNPLQADPAEVGAFHYTPNTFFEDQMTAFEVWLAMGPEGKQPPEQLPIVLQVLLSQAHRLRALKLLASFLQIGAWAIDHALSVGIFPYVLKLLQSPAPELRQELVFIWGKVLALDTSCVVDLVKEKGQVHFLEFLASPNPPMVYLAMSFFVLSVVATEFPDQLARMLRSSPPGSAQILMPQDALANLVGIAKDDEASDCRMTAVSALGALVVNMLAGNRSDGTPTQEDSVQEPQKMPSQKRLGLLNLLDEGTVLRILNLFVVVEENDQSPMVRKEIALHLLLIIRILAFDMQRFSPDSASQGASDIFRSTLLLLASLEDDPHPIVSGLARESRALLSPPGVKQQSAGEGLESVYMVNRASHQGMAPQEAHEDLELKHSETPVLDQLARFVSNFNISARKDPPSLLVKEEVYRTVPFVSCGSNDEAKAAIAAQPSTYTTFCRSLLHLRCDGSEASEPYLARQSMKASFVSARKQFFESDANSLWTEETAVDFVNGLHEVGTFETRGGEIWCCELLPLDPMIVIGDSNGVVSIWNIETESREVQFGLPRYCPEDIVGVTSLCILEGNIERPAIAAGAADGNVAVWTHRDHMRKQSLVSNWRASGSSKQRLAFMNVPLPTGGGHGLVMSWNDVQMEIVAGGCEGGVLRVWNVVRETCSTCKAVWQEEPLTAVDSYEDSIAVGGLLGSAALVDRRSQQIVMNFARDKKSLHSPTVSVAQQSFNNNQKGLVTANLDGTVRIWDTRAPQVPLLSTRPHQDSELTCMTAHRTVHNVLATGSGCGEVTFINEEGKTLREIRFHEGFLSQRIGPVTSLSLHPKKHLLAVGCANSMLSLYK